MNHPDEEKRRWQRYRVTMRATLAITRGGTEHRFSGTCYDISEGGTRIVVVGELHPGEEIKLRLALPYGAPVEVLGVIRDRHGFEYGVQFTDVPAASRHSIIRNCVALSLLA
jgi:c-di-GMP-binding flagellar brake protein YcgR